MDVRAYWEAVLAQDREALPGYFWPDAVIRWHCTNEQFSVTEFVQANCDYPGAWQGEMERLEATETGYVTVVRVFSADRQASCHAVSWITVADGKISALDEYWADDGEAPDWRRALGIGRSIRPWNRRGGKS